MTSDMPQGAIATGSTERSRAAAKPARVPHVGSGRAQLSQVEHALCPLDPVASLRDHLVHGTTYGYRDRKGHLVMANVRVTCPSGLSAADEFAERLENVRITAGCSASGAAGSTTYHNVSRSPCQEMMLGDDGPVLSSA